ncbi:MAG: TerB family tellurite resistance protein [Myxococcales bacterium]|nr:TerB family tellurite resistance protein [Myxococcales bacterium]
MAAMNAQQESMVKSLVAVAWADGRMEQEESEVVQALVSAFEIAPEDVEAVLEYARTPRTLDDAPIAGLTPEQRKTLLEHAVILTYIDGEQDAQERAVLRDLIGRLGLSEEEAATILVTAEERARRLLDLL